MLGNEYFRHLIARKSNHCVDINHNIGTHCQNTQACASAQYTLGSIIYGFVHCGICTSRGPLVPTAQYDESAVAKRRQAVDVYPSREVRGVLTNPRSMKGANN